ncbi:MAG: FprA family A-type flavoprotein, partial [bacterium]
AGVFGSYGWGGGATAQITKLLKENGINTMADELKVQYVPNEEEIKRSYEWGRQLSKSIA